MYSLRDFSMYYRGAWIQTPDDHRAKYVMVGDCRDDETVNLMKEDGTNFNVPLADLLNWKKLAAPELGWRSSGEEGFPVYMYRGSQGTTPKGFRPDQVEMFMPIEDGKSHRVPISEVYNPVLVLPNDDACRDIFSGVVMSRAFSTRVILTADMKSRVPRITIWNRRAKIGSVDENFNKTFVTDDLPEELVAWR